MVAGPDLTALALDVLQLAHDTSVPHQEPRSSPDGGGVNFLLVALGAVVTLALVGSLLWVKQRMLKAEERERAERQASAGAEGAG